MQIARRLLREFWLPALLAAIWTAYNTISAPSVWGLKDFVNVFAPSFFLASWVTGQFFRLQKQVGIEKDLLSLDTRVGILVKLNQEQFAKLERVLELVVPERRADPSQGEGSDEVIPLSRVVDFFDPVAPFYNKRNTGKYLATYIEINAAIRALRPSLVGISVCDVGGGTGTLLRWFMDQGVHWTNIDISRRSLAIFQSEFATYTSKSQRNLDVRKDLLFQPNEQFDVLVMCYLWSSLDSPPDFDQVREAMHDQSLLVVADNHFSYVQKNPRYGFENINGRNLSIFPRPMFPDDLRAQVQAFGLVELSYKMVEFDGAEPYSQVHVFKRSNPSIERTSASGLRPLAVAAHVKR